MINLTPEMQIKTKMRSRFYPLHWRRPSILLQALGEQAICTLLANRPYQTAVWWCRSTLPNNPTLGKGSFSTLLSEMTSMLGWSLHSYL
jgi:hypothetical protein